MRQDHRFQRKRWLDDDQKRMIPVIVIPAIVICLMVIIVFADHRKAAKEAAASQPSAGTEAVQELSDGQDGPDGAGTDSSGEDAPGNGDAEADASGETGDAEDGGTEQENTEQEDTDQAEQENAEPFVTENFQKDSIPEILDLMKRYFAARADADAETMNQIYGVGEVSVTELEAQKTRMRSNAKYINTIDHVATYVTAGTDADSWLVYAVADIEFYSAKKAAPMIMWCYVTRDGDGSYRILNNEALSEEQQKLVSNVNHSEPVRRLASDVNGRLKEALNSDDELREIYGVLRDGSPVWKGEDEEQVKILEEPEESGETPEGSAGAENGGEAPEGSAETENGGEVPEAAGEDGESAADGTAGEGESGENGETGENA